MGVERNKRTLNARIGFIENRHACGRGAVGVMVLANIRGRPLIDAHFDPIWRVCEEAGVPGCLHVVVRFSGASGAFGRAPSRRWPAAPHASRPPRDT